MPPATMPPPEPDDAAARLELNARGYSYHAGLEQLADLRDSDPAEFQRRVGHVTEALGRVEVYADMRESYRRAVAAGVIPDDRGPRAV